MTSTNPQFKGRDYWLFDSEEKLFAEWLDTPAAQMHLRCEPGYHTFIELGRRQFRLWNQPGTGWTIEPCIYR